MVIDPFFSTVAALIGGLTLFLERRRRRWRRPCWRYPLVGAAAEGGWRVACASLPHQLYLCALALMLLALCNVRLTSEETLAEADARAVGGVAREGIAIYFVLDQSRSMEEEVTLAGTGGRLRRVKKRDLLKEVTLEFIEGSAASGLQGRPNDMLGVVGFSRSAQVLVPLTLDHGELVRTLSQFDTMRIKDQDGTAIGYAIYKSANLVVAARHFIEERRRQGKPAYDLKNAVMILISDGLPETNPLDKGNALRTISVEDAAAFAAMNKVRLYIINVEPKLAQEQYGPYRRLMQKAAAATGGEFFMAGQEQSLAAIYQQIDRLEKSALPTPPAVAKQPQQHVTVTSFFLYPWVLGAALLLLALGWLLETTVLRVVP